MKRLAVSLLLIIPIGCDEASDGGGDTGGSGGVDSDGETEGEDGGGNGATDPCLDYRLPGPCSTAACEWVEGDRIEFDLGYCGCAGPDEGVCVKADAYQRTDEPAAYFFDNMLDTVIVVQSGLDPVPEGLSDCQASTGEFCACAVGESMYCNF